jgi:hypothetical protein
LPGSLTIPVLRTFETACHHYFANKEIAAEDQVGKILYNFESATVQSWVLAEKERLSALTFRVFMTKFKLKFLVRSWEDELIQDQITCQSTTPFLTWINKVHNANNELHATGSSYYIEPSDLCKHLVPCLSPALKRLYNGNNGVPPGATVGMLDAIMALEDWQERVCLLKQDLDTRRSQWVMDTKKPRTTTATPVMAPAITVSTSNAYQLPPIPRLTNEEKTLLLMYLSCFKCRTFYARHISPNCKVTRCTLETCKNMTPEGAAKAKAAFKKRKTATVIVVVFEESDDEDFFENCEEHGEGDEYMPPPPCPSLNISDGHVASMHLLHVPPRLSLPLLTMDLPQC